MALCDANYKFTYIDVGCKGRISDGGVFNRSTLYHAIENNLLNIPPPRNLPGTEIKSPFVILADDAFALKTYLIKPYNFRDQNRSQQIFNYRLSRARRMIESSFGIMAARFRLLRFIIELSEPNVKLCVLAICVLHNWLMSEEPNEYLQAFRDVGEISQDDDNAAPANDERNSTNDAKNIREIFKNYFVSPVGSVHWQNDMI